MMDPMQAQLDAFNTRDLEAFITCFDPEIVIEGPDGARMMRGHEEMRAMYVQLFAQSPELHCKVTNRIRVGAYAIDEEHTTGLSSPGSRHSYMGLWCAVWREGGSRICAF